MRSLLSLVGFVLLLSSGCSGEQETTKPQPPSPQPQQAASTALQTFQQLVNAQNYRSLGFESVDEVKNAALGQPLAISLVTLESLRAYKPGAQIESVLTQSADNLYPVTVGGQVRSSVTITKVEGGYRASSFGSADRIKAISRYRGESTAFLLRIPALNLDYLAQRTDKGLMLTPTVDDPRIKLRPGTPVPAADVFDQLAPIARAYNGLPM